MRKKLPVNVYTQLNTVADAYLIQNLSKKAHLVVISSVEQPDKGDPYDLSIGPLLGISQVQHVGLLWGMPRGNGSVPVSIME